MTRKSILIVAVLFTLARGAAGFDLTAEFARAKPGAVIDVPAGTFPGGLTIPAGATLRGAGYRQTTIDSRGVAIAITAKGAGARIENLTILNSGTGIELSATHSATVSQVMILGGTIGVRASDVTKTTIENTIVARALIGISLNKIVGGTVANCTVATANACGISVSAATDTAVLNNLIVDAGTGIVVGGENKRLAIDYNGYIALSIGKIEGQLQRPTLPTWRDVSGGLDAHSLQLNVTFANAAQNDFHPVSSWSWNPNRNTTAGWGIAELAGHKAPSADLDGQERRGQFGLGAFEAPDESTAPLSAPLDGQFEIAADEGLKSAGLFTASGNAVHYLFQGLPLKKGTYRFALPARDMFGRTIPAGHYELRVVESTVDWVYRGMTSNAGADNTPQNADSVHVGLVAYAGVEKGARHVAPIPVSGRIPAVAPSQSPFSTGSYAPEGHVLSASGWSERHINLRLGDPATGKADWVFQGSADSVGLCVGGGGNGTGASGAGGHAFLVRNGSGKSVDIYKIDLATGIPIARADGRLYVNIKDKFKSQYLGGIAELDGKLFLADTDADKVYFDTAAGLAFSLATVVAKPRSPAADRKHKLVWLVSNREKIVALDATGKPALEFTGVQSPLALSVAGDRLAVASAGTGKIHLLDISNPRQPVQEKTLGRGDGPFGKWLPDRFHFQTHPRNPNNGSVSLALADDGSVTLRDSSARVVSFGPHGEVLHSGFAQWGGDPFFAPLAGDARLRAFDSSAAVSYFIDPKTGGWTPDAYWGLPPMVQPTLRGFFSARGKNFGVFTCQNAAGGGEDILIVNYDEGDHLARAVARYQRNRLGGYLLRRDTNHDGLIDAQDEPGKPVLDADGKPLTAQLSGRFMFVDRDGSIYHSGNQLALVWKFKGVDGQGVPAYEFPRDMIFTAKDPIVPSPYFADKTEDLRCASTARLAPDGGICAGINLHYTPNGMGLSNSGATDLARWNADHSLRWLRATNDYSPIQGIEPFPGVTISSWGHQAEFMALDDDGLELGRFGFPAAVNWSGFWVDHPTEWDATRTADGNVQVIIGDYMQNCHHWMTVRNVPAVRKSRQEIVIAPAKARELAYRPPVLHQRIGQATAPEIVIKKLGGPLAIDGQMQKWRSFAPQILLTPQTAVGKIDGPADCSGVVRLAYHDHDLYGQAIVFDNVVSFHQPASRFYQGDSLQFCLNGFLTGFAFNLAQTVDKGPIFFRNRFFFQKMDLDLDPARAPRVIKKFATAKDIPERQYIESIYGVDLAESPGYIVEFKLPLDATTYQGDEKIVPQVESGKWFWLGFMLNDNDVPGTDVQNYIAWPGTFGMFNPQEAGAKAIFE